MDRRSTPICALLAVLVLAGCFAPENPDGASTTAHPTVGVDATQPGRTSDPLPQPVVAKITVRADPFALTASCPAAITFTAQITASGRGDVSYRWVRSDGAVARPATLTFIDDGPQEVATTWTLGDPGTSYEGWQAVEIISPRRQTSERANFALTCVK